MTDPAPAPHNPYRGNKAITILRIFLWLLPAGILIFGIFLGAGLGNFLPQELGIPVAAIFTIAAVAAIGYFDHRLSLQQRRKAPPHEKRELIRWTIIFVLLQIIIAPVIAFAVAYGICLALMSGYF